MELINCLKDYWSLVDLMSVILTMKAKGRSFKTTGNGCGKTRMDGEKIYLPSYDFLDKYSIKLKIVSEEFLSLLQENGFVDKYDIATVKVVNKKNELLTDKKYYALRINHFDNDSFHFGKGITYQSDLQKERGTCFTVYPDMKLKDSSIKQNFFVLDSIEYGDGIIFRKRVLDKVLHLYRPEIYKLSDYSKIWNNRGNYLYGNELMIVK